MKPHSRILVILILIFMVSGINSIYAHITIQDEITFKVMQLKTDPNNLDVLLSIANNCSRIRQYDKAIEYLNKARAVCSLSPDSEKQESLGIVLALLGKAYLMKNDMPNAFRNFIVAIDYQSGYVPSLLGLAKLYLEYEDPYNAYILYQTGIELTKDNLMVLDDLTELYLRQHEYASALDVINSIIAINNEFPEIWVSRAEMNIALGNYKQAEKDVAKIITNFQTEEHATLMQIAVLDGLGKHTESKELADEWEAKIQRWMKAKDVTKYTMVPGRGDRADKRKRNLIRWYQLNLYRRNYPEVLNTKMALYTNYRSEKQHLRDILFYAKKAEPLTPQQQDAVIGFEKEYQQYITNRHELLNSFLTNQTRLFEKFKSITEKFALSGEKIPPPHISDSGFRLYNLYKLGGIRWPLFAEAEKVTYRGRTEPIISDERSVQLMKTVFPLMIILIIAFGMLHSCFIAATRVPYLLTTAADDWPLFDVFKSGLTQIITGTIINSTIGLISYANIAPYGIIFRMRAVLSIITGLLFIATAAISVSRYTKYKKHFWEKIHGWTPYTIGIAVGLIPNWETMNILAGGIQSGEIIKAIIGILSFQIGFGAATIAFGAGVYWLNRKLFKQKNIHTINALFLILYSIVVLFGVVYIIGGLLDWI